MIMSINFTNIELIVVYQINSTQNNGLNLFENQNIKESYSYDDDFLFFTTYHYYHRLVLNTTII